MFYLFVSGQLNVVHVCTFTADSVFVEFIAI